MITALLLPLLTHAYAGHNTRYMADDYCTAAVAIRTDIGSAVVHWYQTWSGRYTAVAIMAVLGQHPPQIYAVIVPLLLAGWFAAALWVLNSLFALLGLNDRQWLALLFASLISYAVFDGLPNVVQSIYWVTSAVTYLLPLIGLLVYLGLTMAIMRVSISAGLYVVALVGSLCLLFAASGCSETFAALQITILTLALISSGRAAPSRLRPRLRIWLVLGLVVTVIGLIIMMRAPGNSVRQGLFEPIAPLPVIIERSIVATIGYVLFALWRFTLIPLLVVLGLSAVIAYRTPFPPRLGRLSRGRIRKELLATLGLTLLTMAATIAPSVYALSTPPPARVYVLPQLALISGTAVWGLLIGWGVQNSDRQGRLQRSRAAIYGASVCLIILLVAGPLTGALRTFAQGREFDIYAQDWDAQDARFQAAKASGSTDITLKPVRFDMAAAADLDRLNHDPSSLANGCAASYYGLQSVRVQ